MLSLLLFCLGARPHTRKRTHNKHCLTNTHTLKHTTTQPTKHHRVSGFPNMNAVALEDATGANYVDTLDFLKVGVPGSILAYGTIVSVGYVLMRAVGY